MKDDERSSRPTSQTDDNIVAVDKMVKEDRNVMSRLIADTLGIPKTGFTDFKRRFEETKHLGTFGSKDLTVSDSKTSRNIEPPPILARFVSP